MTIGHDNWNGCHFGASWCCRNAAGILWRCPLLLHLQPLLLPGVKQGQDVHSVFSRAIAAIFLSYVLRSVNLATTHLVNMLLLYQKHTCANEVLIVDFYRFLWTVLLLQLCALEPPSGFGLVCYCCCRSPFLLPLLVTHGPAPSQYILALILIQL